MEESKEKEQSVLGAEKVSKPKSSGNKNFRKHNKLGFYRLMQRKEKSKTKPKILPVDISPLEE